MTSLAKAAPSPTEAEPHAFTPEKADYLLETIVCGAYESAMQVAALAALLSVCTRTGDASRMQSFRHILIDDSEVMLFALSYREDIGLGAQAVESLQMLYRGMAGAKRSLAPLMKSKGAGAHDREAARSAAQVWRQIAEAAAKAIEQLQDIVRARLHPTYERDGRRVIGFLRQAVNGDGKVFDKQGALVLPVLEQRRTMPRYPVRQACKIVMSTGAHRAQLADVSKQGMAIVCSVSPVVGETVTVELLDGRKLGATVVRTQGDKIGLRLARSLAMSDPLFAARD
jgi:hypothetical protein